MTVLKHQSHLLTGGDPGDTDPGVTITAGSTTPAAQQLLQVADFGGAPVWSCPAKDLYQSAVYGDRLNAMLSTLGVFICLNGIEDPPCIEFPNGNTGNDGPKWWSGAGAPSASTVGDATQGDFYVRTDGGAGSTLYRCTVSGSPGTWVARSI